MQCPNIKKKKKRTTGSHHFRGKRHFFLTTGFVTHEAMSCHTSTSHTIFSEIQSFSITDSMSGLTLLLQSRRRWQRMWWQ